MGCGAQMMRKSFFVIRDGTWEEFKEGYAEEKGIQQNGPYRTSSRTATVFLWRITFGGVSAGHGDGNNRKKEHCSWWFAVYGGKYEWRAPNRVLVVQLGTDEEEAKVFRAHAVLQGL